MTIAKAMAHYAVSLSYDDLEAEVIGEARRRIVDAVGVSFGALDVKPVMIAKDPEKWNPQTKETADHSLPYIVDRALLDGGIWLDSYDQSKIEDDNAKRLLKVTKVRVNPTYDSLYPGVVPSRVTVESDGASEAVEIIYPRSHCKNPLTDDEIQSKYIRLGAPEDVLPKLWNIEKYSANDIMQSLTGGN